MCREFGFIQIGTLCSTNSYDFIGLLGCVNCKSTGTVLHLYRVFCYLLMKRADWLISMCALVAAVPL